MKYLRVTLTALLLISLTFSILCSAQDQVSDALRYEVHRTSPVISVSNENVKSALTLADLGDDSKPLSLSFDPSWIRKYYSVEILTIHHGKKRTALSKNDTLTREQSDNMNMADAGTKISVKIRYLPENTLAHNDVKEIDFTFYINPDNNAGFPGGQPALNQYLKENAIDKIDAGGFDDDDLAAIKFTVSEKGEIINAHIFESMYHSHKREKIDALLLETVCNMPRWTPAAYADGTKVKQDFVLTVGNMESCVMNLLDIQHN